MRAAISSGRKAEREAPTHRYRGVAQAADTGAALMIPVAAATMGPAAYGDLATGVLTTVI